MQLPRATRLFIRIRGKQHYLWRAVDQDGNVLDILVQSRRSATAAEAVLSQVPEGLLKGLRYVPRVIVTDKLKSYAAAQREILPSVEHRQSRYLNNRVEVSHQPTRRRERQTKRFKSARYAQLFLSTHSRIHNRMAIWASAFVERICAAVSHCGCANYWNSLTRDAASKWHSAYPAS